MGLFWVECWVGFGFVDLWWVWVLGFLRGVSALGVVCGVFVLLLVFEFCFG